MRIAFGVQTLLQKALKAVESMEPIVYCGMYDCGLSYIFHLLPPLFATELGKDTAIVFADLSNCGTPEKTQKELAFALRKALLNRGITEDYLSMTEALGAVGRKRKIALVIYLGQGENVDAELLLFLSRMRNLLAWRFSYCLFLGTRFLFQSPQAELVDNIVRQTAVPVLPRTQQDSFVVIENYEERWRKKIPKLQKDQIVKLSGGNPGLIKALSLQVLEDPTWKKPDLLDERLFYRLQEIVHDLPQHYLRILSSEAKSKQDKVIQAFLVRYGYLVKIDVEYKVFTPLVAEFLSAYVDKIPHQKPEGPYAVDQELLELSKSQRAVLSYLRAHPGEIVSRDALAQLLWGEGWADRYSDWAIDQLLSVLRDKLTKFRIKGKIVTKKGEGIIFLP